MQVGTVGTNLLILLVQYSIDNPRYCTSRNPAGVPMKRELTVVA